MPLTPRDEDGFTLVEVLVTFLIIVLGLMGLGALQLNSMNNTFETYQRALVASLVEDMAARIRINHAGALGGGYFATLPDEASCAGILGSSAVVSVSQRDLCEWQLMLRGGGTTVTDGSGTVARNVGAPLGARGCIAPLPGSGGEELWIRISVAWVGVTPQPETTLACGAGDMGDEAYRRVVFRDVAVR